MDSSAVMRDLLSYKKVKNILSNPLYVSLLLSTIIFIVVYNIFDDDKLCKTWFWITVSTLCIIFTHNKVIKDIYGDAFYKEEGMQLIASIQDGPIEKSLNTNPNNIEGGDKFINSAYVVRGSNDLNYINPL